MRRITRREAIGTLVTASMVAALADVTNGDVVMAAEEGQPSSGGTPPPVPAYRGANQIKPLPFEPGKLKGLSEKLITSHHQNNYGGGPSNGSTRSSNKSAACRKMRPPTRWARPSARNSSPQIR
jgi:hypothetical protein